MLPNGRYDETRGNRASTYQGRYEIRENHIDYRDDTGFTADGTFIDGVLHQAGMICIGRGSRRSSNLDKKVSHRAAAPYVIWCEAKK
ncbi:Atu4866 domain-containing protein [Mesorhizobium delmotii]|uniref:Uncharacterized protein n=1 Tax=Mesorhizobium delmotii TaxID=1631247 RepID=A0A2P9AWL1_9HYPH|nr:Atu4866 domain-containing protein [Mesorhizobium delmotii]SJM35563.1 hypothetical protein BQ8482_80197 [Mesorhizobium delmotii]